MEHSVNVWGKQYQVSVHQSSKTVWIAVGYYMNARVEAKGRSATSALSAWQEAARYRGG